MYASYSLLLPFFTDSSFGFSLLWKLCNIFRLCMCAPMHAQVCRHEAYKGKLEVPSSDIPQGLSTLSFEAGYLIGT